VEIPALEEKAVSDVGTQPASSLPAYTVCFKQVFLQHLNAAASLSTVLALNAMAHSQMRVRQQAVWPQSKLFRG
jgi:hypothetical protein